ncbi:type 1 periplasmic-binding domain-containing protein [Nocardioides terrisoli]|uniref:hypothetical protein n=1 Tax=Nocardioides terrisoli TaxID=3388267 RepID=UPI00287BA657|nr:hypothetical protein [Nocardioides marmorisolisilvae]
MNRVLGAAALAAALVLLSGCGSSSGDPVQPTDVTLGSHQIPDDVQIGLIVTLKSAPGQGAEWLSSAAGTEVATYQYHLGGHRVTLDVVDDKGTRSGARKAVQTLVGEGVSGIVAATSGQHLVGSLDQAAESGTAVLLPYQSNPAGLQRNEWLTGPTSTQLGATMATMIADNGWQHPLLVTSAGQRVDGLPNATVLKVSSHAQPAAVFRKIRAARTSEGVDIVVLAVPADLQAGVVKAVQSAKRDIPILLGRDAVSPTFADTLVKLGGSLAGQFTTAGLDAGDVTAVGAGASGDRAASFFSALGLASSDANTKDLFGQGPFSAQAGSADIASHDAVVALVAAATQAGSAAPGKVLATLGKLRVTGSAGLAGPDLDFTRQSAVADSDVLPMHATMQDPGVRPPGLGDPTQLFWFAVPGPQS